MKRILITFSFAAVISCISLKAQITIGAEQMPDSEAVLELVSTNKGFLPTRVNLVEPHNPAPLDHHVAGMVVYNLTLLTDSLTEGLYINDGKQWTRLRNEKHLLPGWFYMPSIPLDVSQAGIFTVNLWEEYKLQFDDTVAGNTIVPSAGAPAKPLPSVNNASDLYYYVTGYDKTVFTDISLTEQGILTYTITATNLANVTDATFMNIVFVER